MKLDPHPQVHLRVYHRKHIRYGTNRGTEDNAQQVVDKSTPILTQPRSKKRIVYPGSTYSYLELMSLTGRTSPTSEQQVISPVGLGPALCVVLGALCYVLVSQASGLEAFSRYPYRRSFATFICRRVANTIHATQRFLSY